MLPYRLRHPATQGNEDRHHDLQARGGPIQAAIYADLLRLRNEFKVGLATKFNEIASDPPSSTPIPAGVAFGVLKKVLGSAKIAMLHTRFAPKRCDRSAYSQLLYATCWSMLDDLFQDETPSDLLSASFAVFSLYLLHETHPLPMGEVKSEREILAMLPMGLNQNTENPGYLYRRHFKQGIRLGLQQYYNLQRLLQIALAKRAVEQPVSFDSDIALATDVAHIIRRLLPVLRICSYTGPCSLEALAGHEAYDHGRAAVDAVVEAVIGDGRSSANNSFPRHMDMATSPMGTLAVVQNDLNHYKETWLGLRIPSTAQSSVQSRLKRVRDALEPMFAKQGINGSFQIIFTAENSGLEQPKRVKLRRVTFGVVDVPLDGTSQASANETSTLHGSKAQSGPISDEDGANDSPSLELILPLGLSAIQADGLTSAVETLLARRKSLLLPVPGNDMADDGVSTLGEGVSHAGESAVSRGRHALQDLLSMVSGTEKHSSATDSFFESKTIASPVLHEKRARVFEEEDPLSDLSQDEDELSIAASAVGRKALDHLLQKSVRPRKNGRMSRKSKRPESTSTRSVRKQVSHLNAMASETGNALDDGSASEVSEVSDLKATGKRALLSLLSLAKSK